MLLYRPHYFLPGVINTCTFMVCTFTTCNELPDVPLVREALATAHDSASCAPGLILQGFVSKEIAPPSWDQPGPHLEKQSPRPCLALCSQRAALDWPSELHILILAVLDTQSGPLTWNRKLLPVAPGQLLSLYKCVFFPALSGLVSIC